jgi:hypothetical protein
MFVIFDWFKFDLVVKTNEFAVGNLTLIIYIVYWLMGICTIVYAVLLLKQFKWQAFIPTMIFLIAVLYVSIYPMTNLYFNKDYISNAGKRIQTVKMLEQHQLTEYQIGQDEYMVPYRSTSRTDTMLVQEKSNVIKIMFYIYRGFGINKVLVYVSDDSGIEPNDFNFELPSYTQNFKNIKKMDDNWYSAIIK